MFLVCLSASLYVLSLISIICFEIAFACIYSLYRRMIFFACWNINKYTKVIFPFIENCIQNKDFFPKKKTFFGCTKSRKTILFSFINLQHKESKIMINILGTIDHNQYRSSKTMLQAVWTWKIIHLFKRK